MGTTGYSATISCGDRPVRTVRLPSPGRARPLEEREPDRGVVREHGRRASAQCSSDRSLGARLDVERGEGEPGAVLGQSASSGRKALLLGERLIERSNPLTDELDPLIQRDPLALGAPGSLGCLDRLELETCGVARLIGRSRLSRSLRAEALQQRCSRLRAQLEPLDSALQPVASRDRGLASSGRVRELLLGSRPLPEKSLESALGASL